MSHKTFGTKDAMRQNQQILQPLKPETKRSAAITVIQQNPDPDEHVLFLKMLGLIT